MKFRCGRDWVRFIEKQEAKARTRYGDGEWQRWFAWYPVETRPGECRWLEFVDRRLDFVGPLFGTVFLQYRTRR